MVGKLRNRLTLLAVAVVAGACGRAPVSDALEATMHQAGANGRELGEALGHYSAPGDSLHAAAMHFLVANMAGKTTVAGPAVDEFYAFIDSVYTIRQPEYDIPAIYAQFRSGARYADAPLETRLDAATLPASYLIDNVDRAMALRGKPWNRHLSFAEFCEYVLPYRVESEEAQPWREVYAARFAPLVADTATALEAATAINDSLKNFKMRIARECVVPFPLRPSTLLNLKFGLCGEYVALTVYAMRSAGIPATYNIVPHWGRRKGSHAFNAILNSDGEWLDFLGVEDDPGGHLRRFAHGIPKIYRKGFRIQPDALPLVCGREAIPVMFRDPTLKDVTTDFKTADVSDVTITVPEQVKNKIAYLCVFTTQGWSPVAWSKIKGKEALFKAIGREIVYQPAFYADDEVKPFGEAFKLDSLGTKRLFTAGNKKHSITLNRKNPVPDTYYWYLDGIPGTRFEGSDNPDFRNPVLLHRITEKPEFSFTRIDIPTTKSLQYLRYMPPAESHGNIAEVEFIGPDGCKLSGEIIHGSKVVSKELIENINNLFDGDPDSFFNYETGNVWGGIKLDKPEKVTAIRFLMRNDGNRIIPGNEYRLYYAEGGKWKLLEGKVAEADDSIVFNNVPSGALLRLSSNKGEDDERIFEVDDKDNVIWY